MNFEALKEEILKCDSCKEKFGFEPHPIVFGNQKSKIMQISQAPSQNVHKTLTPFDDASGRKLRNEWYQISDEEFYNPDNFYITSIAHCYPGKSANGGDRLPPKICATTWLTKEIEVVDNEIYIILGAKAASFFFPKEDYTSLIFSNKEINNKPVFVLPHPSPLNARWFKENPHFLSERVFDIRTAIHALLR
ncbi:MULTISPECIES: uracil-DNA glycosylase family protein [Listeria]|uniref:uracil-DNA glycosylase family protein n=1 Tax=Listeria TaxID=1637 RepID=UPI0010B3A710|nr:MULTISPECIES: uracil-DNA glycosylase family protein [Listeria]EAH4443674.1 uracil-DNA glycosylase [Listeria innocua]ECJ9371626.1 uracil-DNA glycosylase [Listeria innocua]EDO1164294.1 uracil-DNA glycosylase [Listeria innocua]EDO1177085.1 uracil-DNA glycosylase [Listeria innocua]EEU8426472.1 uracil-DNA glycosylase [Listeria innocua]